MAIIEHAYHQLKKGIRLPIEILEKCQKLAKGRISVMEEILIGACRAL